MMRWESIKTNSTKYKELKKTEVLSSVFFSAINNKLELLTVKLLMDC